MSSCNIRLTVPSDILNEMAFLIADRRGLLTKLGRTSSMFSGVLSEGSLPGGFLFARRSCFPEVPRPQQYSIANSDTVVPMNIEVSTKYPAESQLQNLCFFFKYVSTAKARCSTDQRFIANEIL
jgi:hypothetical protein